MFAHEDSDNSTDDERTTDDESSEDDDIMTNIAISGLRSTSRSTLATSYAGTQSASRSTLETSGSFQGSYPGHEGSSSAFFGKDSDSSLPKCGMDSGGIVVAAAASATNRSESSSDEDSSSSYDSDSSDEYSSDVDNASTTEENLTQPESIEGVSIPTTGELHLDAMDAADTVAATAIPASTVIDSRTNVEPSAIVGAHVASANVENLSQDDLVRGRRGVGHSSFGSSGGAGFTESATLAESGDTFLATEEAAHITNPDDIAVTKTRFAPGISPAKRKDQSDDSLSADVVTAAVGAVVLGVGAVATFATHEAGDQEPSSESESVSSGSSEDDSFDSRSSSESSGDSDSSDESTTDYNNESDSNVSNNGQNMCSPEAEAKPTSILLASNIATGAANNDELVGEFSDLDLRGQLKPVRSEGAISRKREGNLRSPGPGIRAQLLRARSDAALPGVKRDETLQDLLTAWDQDYDLTSGEERTVSSDESLVVLYANAGLPPIEESGLSDESSPSLSLASLHDTLPSENAIAASIQHGSASLLNFDYSLRTVAEEQSGEISYHEGDFSASSGEYAAALDAKFEKEVIRGLDTIGEHSEVLDGRGFKHNLPEAASPTEAKRSLQASQTVGGKGVPVGSSGQLNVEYENSGSYSRSTLTSEQAWDSKETIQGDSSDDSSYSSSEYTSESSDSSDSRSSSNSSDDDSDDSSSSGSTPEPSSPNTVKALREAQSLGLQNEVSLRSLAEEQDQSQMGSLAGESARMPSLEERDALAESEAWAAIAAASKPRVEDEGAGDAAEWAIKRSLSALKIAEEQASFVASSSASLSASSSNDLFSSDYTSYDDSRKGSV